MDLALGLRLGREAAGITIGELSRRTGISTAHLAACERGERMPSISTVGKIATALGTSLSQLSTLSAEKDELPTGLIDLHKANVNLVQLIIAARNALNKRALDAEQSCARSA